MDREAIDKLREEVEVLGTDEGAARFIAQHTGLSYDRALRIYDLGKPWMAAGKGTNCEREAEEFGVDIDTYLEGIKPLLRLDEEQKNAELEAYQEALKRGETPKPSPGLGTSELHAHLEEVATFLGEPLEVIWAVWGWVLDLRKRMWELDQQASDLAQADT